MRTRIYHGMRLTVSFLYQLAASNLAVLKIVLSPNINVRSGVLAYNTLLRTEAGVTLLANLITLTPGTLTLDVSENRQTLYIHTLHIESAEAVRSTIRNAFEKHLLELER